MAITKRNQNKWLIQIITGYTIDENGIKKQKKYSETFYGKKSDARIRENKLKAKVKKGTFFDNERITFNDLIDKWYIEIAEPTLQIKTVDEYKKLLVLIRDELGFYKLTELRSIHLLEFYNKLRSRQKKLSESTILHYYTLINRILNIGVRWDFINKNVNSQIDRPKPMKQQATYYDKNEVNQLLQCLQNESLKYQVVIKLAIDSGCRRGELTGLEWSDVDFNNYTININKTTQFTSVGVIEKSCPKNSSSIRIVSIMPETIDLLRKYKHEQEILKQKLGNKWINSNKVLINNYGDKMHPDTPSKILKKIIDKYNLPKMKFHGLRHTSASLLIASNVHTKVISKRLGHSSTNITDTIYCHVFDKLDKEAITKMSDYLHK